MQSNKKIWSVNFSQKLQAVMMYVPYGQYKSVMKTALNLFGVEHLIDLPEDKYQAFLNHFMEKKEYIDFIKEVGIYDNKEYVPITREELLDDI